MLENLEKYHIILASNSPRRRELLGGLDIKFEVKVLPDIEESYPDDLSVSQIAVAVQLLPSSDHVYTGVPYL